MKEQWLSLPQLVPREERVVENLQLLNRNFRLAQAAMGARNTKVSELCSEIGVTRVNGQVKLNQMVEQN